MMNHTNCDHPATSSARAKCRREADRQVEANTNHDLTAHDIPAPLAFYPMPKSTARDMAAAGFKREDHIRIYLPDGRTIDAILLGQRVRGFKSFDFGSRSGDTGTELVIHPDDRPWGRGPVRIYLRKIDRIERIS